MNSGSSTFRATGIAAYQKDSGKLEVAQLVANQEGLWTTKFYDHGQDKIPLDEVERIEI